jgi:hypothetical protein
MKSREENLSSQFSDASVINLSSQYSDGSVIKNIYFYLIFIKI